MNTLDHWRSRLTAIPATIECSEMRIMGRDHEPLVFVGPGHIDITDSNVITFRMFAAAPDFTYALACMLRAQQNRYETLDQFRLFATDYEGQEWACGWIGPQFEQESAVGWLIGGTLQSLAAHISESWVAKESGVELIFQPGLEVPLTESMLTISSMDGEERGRSWHVAQHVAHALGANITFFQAPAEDVLLVTALCTEKLTHPYAENWLAEPLRILLGQLAYPRLVARNLGNGSAHVWLRSAPRRSRNSRMASLMAGSSSSDYEKRFWDLYTGLLTMIGEARNDQGQPNFEGHPVTRFYEEIIQANQGSRWVQSMTLASVSEGLAKMLMTPDEHTAEFAAEDVNSLRSLIDNWNGSLTLKGRVMSWFSRLGEKSVPAYLRDLQKQGILKNEQVQSWTKIRNAVMHGNLTSPWATQEDDRRLAELASLVRSLTMELLASETKR